MTFQQQPHPRYQVPKKPLLVASLRFLICEERKFGWCLFHFKVFNMLGFRLFQRMIIFKVMNLEIEWEDKIGTSLYFLRTD